MTATSTPQTTTSSPQAPSIRTSAIVGVLTYAVGAVLTAPEAHDTTEVVMVLSIAAVVGLAVFGWVVPQGITRGAPATALALSTIAAVLFLPAYWSMLPLLLGVAGVMLGYACIAYAPKRAYAAMGLGGLTVAGFFYLYLVVSLIMNDL